jgi:hypothetical protein
MAPGTHAPVPPPVVLCPVPTCSTGGFTFAEDPCIGAPDARILWTGAVDPGVLPVMVLPATAATDDTIAMADVAPWLTVVPGDRGREHAVLSDGWRRIRLDVEAGSLAAGGLVNLHYPLHGIRSVEPKVLPLRRLVAFCRGRRFAATLFPPDRRIARWIECLRVADARADGASYRDIAIALYGEPRMRADWVGGGRSLHSRVRRLVATARVMALGGYRDLLRGGTSMERHPESEGS